MLAGQVALVTGASRGIGRGIAVELGAAGATVYVTGRKPQQSDNKDGSVAELPTLEKTANEISERGGKGVAVYCDHSNDDEVKALFERIDSEQSGRLDILVNNAFAAVSAIGASFGKPFWELDASIWDKINQVGLRNHYICSVYGARLMVPRRKGLIVTVSSGGGLQYLFNVAYGVGKCAKDRLAQDMAVELRKFHVASISLWPGAVKTELIQKQINEMDESAKKESAVGAMKDIFDAGESTELSGKIVARLAVDSNLMAKSGKVHINADLAAEYGILDNGVAPMNMRSVKALLYMSKHPTLAAFVPAFIKLPGWVMVAATSKL